MYFKAVITLTEIILFISDTGWVFSILMYWTIKKQKQKNKKSTILEMLGEDLKSFQITNHSKIPHGIPINH